MSRPDERLWALIDASMPDPARFAARVEALSAEQLIELGADAIDARSEVREKWEGPFIPDLEGCLSEDSCEDFTDWVLGQGHDYWWAARGRDDEALAAMFAEDVRERNGARLRWSAGPRRSARRSSTAMTGASPTRRLSSSMAWTPNSRLVPGWRRTTEEHRLR